MGHIRMEKGLWTTFIYHTLFLLGDEILQYVERRGAHTKIYAKGARKGRGDQVHASL